MESKSVEEVGLWLTEEGFKQEIVQKFRGNILIKKGTR